MSNDPVEQAYREGKFPAARRAHWHKQMGRKPKATRRTLAAMAAVLPPPGGEDAAVMEELREEQSHAAPVAATPTGPTKYERGWLLPGEQAAAARGPMLPGSGSVVGETDSLVAAVTAGGAVHQAGTVPLEAAIAHGPGELL